MLEFVLITFYNETNLKQITGCDWADSKLIKSNLNFMQRMFAKLNVFCK